MKKKIMFILIALGLAVGAIAIISSPSVIADAYADGGNTPPPSSNN